MPKTAMKTLNLDFLKSETVSTDFNSQTVNTAILLMYLYCNYLIFYSIIYKINTVKNFKTLLEIIKVIDVIAPTPLVLRPRSPLLRPNTPPCPLLLILRLPPTSHKLLNYQPS